MGIVGGMAIYRITSSKVLCSRLTLRAEILGSPIEGYCCSLGGGHGCGSGCGMSFREKRT